MLDAIIVGYLTDDFYADYILCRCANCRKLMRIYLDEKAIGFINDETLYEVQCAGCAMDDRESETVWFTPVDEEDGGENNC